MLQIVQRFISDGGDPTITYPQIGVVDGTGTPVYTVDPVSVPSGHMVDGYGRRDQLAGQHFQTSYHWVYPFRYLMAINRKQPINVLLLSRQLATISAKEIDNTLRQNVETAYNEALAASKTYNSSLRQVSAREEAYRMTKQRFDIGAVPYVEYQVAENDLFQAKSDLVRAKYDFILKKKVLDFYQGKPLEY